jgi:hypothetical protein
MIVRTEERSEIYKRINEAGSRFVGCLLSNGSARVRVIPEDIPPAPIPAPVLRDGPPIEDLVERVLDMVSLHGVSTVLNDMQIQKEVMGMDNHLTRTSEIPEGSRRAQLLLDAGWQWNDGEWMKPNGLVATESEAKAESLRLMFGVKI